jgi:positive regulator of sigma E activity
LPFYIFELYEEKQTHNIEMVNIKITKLVHNDTSLIKDLNDRVMEAEEIKVYYNEKRLRIYKSSIHFVSSVIGYKKIFYYYPWTSYLFVMTMMFMCLMILFLIADFYFYKKFKKNIDEEKEFEKKILNSEITLNNEILENKKKFKKMKKKNE